MSQRLSLFLIAALIVFAHSGARAVDAPTTFKHITIDGSFEDWAGVPAAYEDPSDSEESADYKTIYVAHDNDYLYVRFTLYKPRAAFTSHENIFVDADNDPSTGFHLFVGSEMLIQGGRGYEERGGRFNEGAVNGLDWGAAPAGAASEFELRISRKATFASDGSPVFNTDTLSFILEAEDANFSRKETAPDSEGVVYTFTPAPPALTGSQNLLSLASSSWRYSAPASQPAPEWKDPGFDDSSWSSGKGAFGFTTNAAAWGEAANTSLPNNTKTAYFRTRFTWNNDPAGIVLVASAFLSDGVVIYLNGAELRRIRMPAGAIAFATAATGGPSTRSQPQVFGLSPGALVNGENVLAVEVHDSAGAPGELLFDLGLQASSAFAVVVTDPTQPADRTLVAGQSTTFTAEVLGTPPISYQWLKDGQPIPGATNATLTIASVLAGNAGNYSLRVSNASGSATSREAVLTVSGTPVAITNAAQPADVTTTEGLSASFTVTASGSAPIAFQWLKGGVPINGETNATLSLTNLALAAAGDYAVQVSNPVNSVTSRTAKLVVNRDTTTPTIQSVSGAPNKVLVTFSEPVDPTTAATRSNYTLTGGLSISGAAVSAENPAAVILTTSAQNLGTNYSLSISGVKDRFGNAIAAGTTRPFLSTILIDGSFDDWAGLPADYNDAEEAPAAGTDFKDVWVFSDPNYIYIHFTLYQPGNPNTFLNNILIDADNDATTGYRTRGIGSEMLLQEGAGYQEKNGAFNEGAITNIDFAVSPAGVGTEFELRISRRARYANDGQNVFTNDTINLFLETENPSFATTDTAPDSGGIQLILAPAPPEPPGPLGVSLQSGKVTISWPGPGKLQSSSTLLPGSWQDVPNATSPYSIAPAGNHVFYRLSSAP